MPGTRPLLMPHALFAKPPKNLARRPQLEDARDIVRGAGLPNLHLRTTDGLPAPGLSIGAIVATTSSRKIAIEIPTTDAVYDCCLNTNIRRAPALQQRRHYGIVRRRSARRGQQATR